jgi:hypothetical protein
MRAIAPDTVLFKASLGSEQVPVDELFDGVAITAAGAEWPVRLFKTAVFACSRIGQTQADLVVLCSGFERHFFF